MTIQERQRNHLARICSENHTPPTPEWESGATVAALAAADTRRAATSMMLLLEECRQYLDATNFRLNRLLRAQFLYHQSIPADVHSLFRDTVLAARYYGGHRPLYPMFYNSENHHMNWATAEYLASQMFPDATFSFDGRSSREHHARARFLIAHWINCRARWGFSEWNSSAYVGVNLMSLLNLVDFAGEPDIRELARTAVTRLLADLAADSIEGMVFGAQARLYEDQLLKPRTQPAALALALLLGAGDPARLATTPGFGEFIATTSYRPPAWLCRLAQTPAIAPLNKERHRSETNIFYYCRSAFWRPPFELTNEQARQNFAPQCMHESFLRTERSNTHIVGALLTPSHISMQHVGAQSMAWLSCLGGDAPVFTTHPPAGESSKALEQYWAGSVTTPRCYLADGVAAVVYHGKAGADFTHGYFPTTSFEAWTQQDRWFFGKVKDACVGLLAPKGASLASQGAWAGREILAPGRTAAWVAVFKTGKEAADFEGFAQFCKRDVLAVFSPDAATLDLRVSGRKICVSYDAGVMENDRPPDFNNWKQLDNAIVQAEYGEPLLRAKTPDGGETILDSSLAENIMREWERRD